MFGVLLPEDNPYTEGAKHMWRFHRRDGVDFLEIVALILALSIPGVAWVFSAYA